jgi:hypothetical protein
MNTVPKVLMVLVVVMLVIFAVYGVVSNVIGNQGDSLLSEGESVEESFGCVFSDRGSADECIESDSGGGGDSEG